jgi:uncharacterized phage-associated protein
MPNHSAIAIANEFVRLAGGPLDQMKLQKLVYVSQGWSLAILGEPLVRDRIEAWDGGPVFRTIWDQIKFLGVSGKGYLYDLGTKRPVFDDTITPNERAVIEHVWRKYGGFSGKQLSDMTHKRGTPWFNAYLRGRNTQISNDEIAEHYRNIALAGRVSATD